MLGVQVLCWAGIARVIADEQRAVVETGQAHLERGDRLADQGQPDAAQLAYKRAFETLLPSIRGLPFHFPVRNDVTPRASLKRFVLEDLETDQTPEELEGEALALVAFGLWPRERDYRETLSRVYSEEIAAFYDPRTKTMHLIREGESAPKPAPGGLLGLLVGRKSGFDKEEAKTVIAHELTHALADQHYNIRALQKQAEHDDDRALALSALIEGEATLAMMAVGREDWTGREIVRTPARNLDRTFALLAPLMPAMGSGSLRQAPPILAESLIFPYLRGLVFCAHLGNQGQWPAIDAAYRQPPLSTEQILHPEKYLEKPDAPQQIELGALPVPPGWTQKHRNVLGEFQISVLLARHRPRQSAAGWDGDAYAVFQNGPDQLGLVWRTTWDSPEDAREFFDAYGQAQARKLKLTLKPEPGDQAGESGQAAGEEPCQILRELAGRQYLVEKRGADVVVIEGFDAAATRALAEAAFAAPAVERRHEAKPMP
jgi:hypothetical protein